MPWKSGTIMDSRLEFVRFVEQGGVSVSELCRRFGISQPCIAATRGRLRSCRAFRRSSAVWPRISASIE